MINSSNKEKLFFYPALCVIVFLALFARLSIWARPYWMDEAEHLLYIYTAKSFGELRKNQNLLFVPLIEPALRMYFWTPILGISENAGRLPSLFFSLLTIILSGILSRSICEKYWPSLWRSAFIGLLVALWFAYSSNEIHYASEARGYSYISFISVVWFSVFCFFPDTKRFIFNTISFLFLNAHFFSVPFIVFAYLYRALGVLFQTKSRKQAILELLTLLALIFSALYLNAPALHGLWGFSYFRSASSSYISRILEVKKIFKAFFGTTCWGERGVWFAALTSIIFSLSPGKKSSLERQALTRVIILLWVVLPATFFIIRSCSSYDYWPRYFLPYSGLLISLLILSLGVTAPKKSVLSALVFAAIILPLGEKISAQKYSGLSEFRKTSKFKEVFEEIVAQPHPSILIITNPVFDSTVEELYFGFFVSKAMPYTLVQSKEFGNNSGLTAFFEPKLSSKFEHYFSNIKQGASSWTVVRIHGSCPSKQPTTSFGGMQPIEARRYYISDNWFGNSCLWIFRGITSYDGLRSAAKESRIPSRWP